MNKPFFFRVNAGDLLDFATDEESEGVTLLRFAKDLQKGTSNIPFIQSLIDEAHNYVEKKRIAGGKGGKAKSSSAKALIEDAKAKSSSAKAEVSIPLASNSNSNSNTNSKDKDCNEHTAFFNTEKRIRECVAEKLDFITSNYPLVNIAEETEEIVAKYRSGSIGVDPWLLILRWIKNIKPKVAETTPPELMTPTERHAALQKRLAL